jgi:hypothetical protein
MLTLPWNKIAEAVPGRSGKQCRERWINHLAPSANIVEGIFTEEEDKIIIREQKRIGNKWKSISSDFLPGRTENAVKNRWHLVLKKQNLEGGNNKHQSKFVNVMSIKQQQIISPSATSKWSNK